jgi:molybdopterin molybdotransferase
MIAVEQALEIVLSRAAPLPAEEIDFRNGLGRLLREDAYADSDLPPFSRSAVDGFAVRSEDARAVPATLKIVGSIPAGSYPGFRIGRGETASIMTGAPLPEGADAVERVEETTEAGGSVTLLSAVTPGQNVTAQGAEVHRGEVVLRAGTRLDAAALAVAATIGKTRLLVGRRPSVSIAATGDELVSPWETPGPGRIRNSNEYSLLAQCRSVGVEPRRLGVAEDTIASLRSFIRRGLESEVLLLSGGVSMGRFDLVEGVLKEAGVEILVDAVALKPGKPLVFGVTTGALSGKLVFGLPGNPVSTMVTFELFVRAALARLEGAERPTREILRARLLEDLASRGPRRAFLPGWLRVDDGGDLVAAPIPSRGSADIVAFSKANALLIVHEEQELVRSGDWVPVYPLDSFLQKEDRWLAAKNPA